MDESQVGLHELKRRLVTVLEGRADICFAVLFGSAAEGRAFRDLDVGVWVDRARIAPTAEFEMEFELENALRNATGHKVDVRVINDAPLGFRYNVSRGALLWAGDEDAYHYFRERTWDEWFDFEPVAIQYLKEQK
jgi:uncharacterized protein